MNAVLSDDTKAILLLTAPLIAGSAGPRIKPLSLGEYKQLTRKLRELGRTPGDLIAPAADDLVEACGAVVDASRLRELLSRGFQMAQAVERWSARGGLAVVGSRNADDDTLAWARHVGTTSAEAGVAVVSGGARGIDDAAVRGSLDAGGRAKVVLADSLEREAINKANRQPVTNKRLVIVSPYDPAARFNVGHAMGRNKLIHCLADASLVVRCDAGSGGTWSGAVEHLGREGATALYVKNGAEAPEGNRALLAKQAVPWPEPMSVDVLRQALDAPPLTKPKPTKRSLFPDLPAEEPRVTPTDEPVPTAATADQIKPIVPASQRLYDAARQIVLDLLRRPQGEKELADVLGIPAALAKTWLAKLMAEGAVEKSRRPVRYRLPGPTAPLPIETVAREVSYSST